jgi:hypothetical protein
MPPTEHGFVFWVGRVELKGAAFAGRNVAEVRPQPVEPFPNQVLVEHVQLVRSILLHGVLQKLVDDEAPGDKILQEPSAAVVDAILHHLRGCSFDRGGCASSFTHAFHCVIQYTTV